MDTALALLEAKEPVYPLDIVQAMRDQRASMVQNVVSTTKPTKYPKYLSFLIYFKSITESVQICL